MLEEEITKPLAPGFSVLPNGELMYQVATDYPKQMANIMADYEARAGSPRYNPFGESPDSSRRLEQELIDPFRDVFAATQPTPKVQPNRFFETGGGIIQVDPNSGKATTIFNPPPNTKIEDKKRMVETTLLTGDIRSLRNLKSKDKFDKELAGYDDAKIDAEIAAKMAKLDELYSGVPEVATNNPVAAPTPRMAFGGLDSELSPIFGSQPVTSTNAPSVSKWVRDSSGKLVRVQ